MKQNSQFYNEKKQIELFSEWYSKDKWIVPHDLSHREIAMEKWSGTYLRHLRFWNREELCKQIQDPPKNLFYSSSYYLSPSSREMDKKQWLMADLIFDIDFPSQSDSLLGLKKSFNWARDQTVDLATTFLQDELGFLPEKDYEIVFSGSKGYHIHLYNKSWIVLEGFERKKLCDYLLPGINKLLKISSNDFPVYPSNWKYRIILSSFRKRLVDILKNYSVKSFFETYGITLKLSKWDKFKNYLHDNLDDIKNLKCKDKEFRIICQKILNITLKFDSGIFLDHKVLIDTKRLTRVTESLNGKSGLRVTKIDTIKSLKNFNPTIDATIDSPEDIYCHINKFCEIEFLDRLWKLEEGENVSIPAPLYLYLCLKGYVSII